MDKKFTLLLLGPAGSGKSAFVASLSKLDIFKYVTAKTPGGANTTKVATTYEFSNNCKEFSVTDCVTKEDKQPEQIISDLQDLSKQNDGLEKVFKKINDNDFSKICKNITIQLPCKEGLIPPNSLFNSFVVRDTRGFGDIDDTSKVNIDELGITHDVNTILFFKISSTQQPAVFSKIIDRIMEVNLKTPMFLLRRDSDLVQNDVHFEKRIIDNISISDSDLSKAVKEIGKHKTKHRLNNFVFNIPEVKKWKGALKVIPEDSKLQMDNYSNALKEILKYSIDMYNELYKILVHKMQGEYQNKFLKMVLNNLLGEKALDLAAEIVKNPHSKPRKGPTARDTKALALPVKLYNGKNGEKPFKYEVNTRGNQHKDGIIPSYSYSCVNFRNIFHKIVSKLVNDYKLKSLFSTFIDIVLKDYTITTYTGYTFRNCKQNAFKFNNFLDIRDICTSLLEKNHLVENEKEWKNFSYSPLGKKYIESEAIAVLIYEKLIKSFELSNAFNKHSESTLKKESSAFVKKNNEGYLLEQMSRN